MFPITRHGKVPMYEQIYNSLKEEIESGRLKAGVRLMSVRRFAETYGVSKITVEQAYAQLAAEGYILPHNRAAYEVLPIYKAKDTMRAMAKQQKDLSEPVVLSVSNKEESPIIYNFATGAMDPEGFDYKRWKRLINAVLKEPARFMSYGEENGERELREAIATYLYDNRGVKTNAEHVVIAGGTQILLNIILSLLLKCGVENISIAAKEKSLLSQTFFKDSSLSFMPWNGQSAEGLTGVNVLYCTPSHSDYRGGVLSISDRLSLLEWAEEQAGYIIEDDYDSELRYFGRPISAMQGLDQAGHVIYLGSVSKVLPPSIRISYMVLPPKLYIVYKQYMDTYRQTAGVLEQLVLAEYMACGEWSRQIRRLRKHYQEKSKYMVMLLKEEFTTCADVTNPEGGVYVCLRLHTVQSVETLLQRAEQEKCAVRFAGMEHGYPTFLLSFSAISTGKLKEAVAALGKAWKGI